jgi:hypothetical protein
MYNDLVSVAGEVVGETAKAFKFADGDITVWLLKSQIRRWDPEAGTLLLPRSLVRQHQLHAMTRCWCEGVENAAR